jgi:hypothetical protein
METVVLLAIGAVALGILIRRFIGTAGGSACDSCERINGCCRSKPNSKN